MALSRTSIALFRFAAAALIIASLVLSSFDMDVVTLLLYFTIQSNIIGIAVLIWGGVYAITGKSIAACPRLRSWPRCH